MSTTSANEQESLAPYGSPLQSMLTINKRLSTDAHTDSKFRAINFMSYELAHQCNNLDDHETLQQLNDFFFETKKFRLGGSLFLLEDILGERTGCGISLALLYMHLAHTLDLDLELVHWPLHSILRWNARNKTQYIDLAQKGKVLTEEDLLILVNKHKEQVRTLSLREAILQYLDYISMYFRQTENVEKLIDCLGMILSLEPESTRALIERALLRKNMGQYKESLSDFKRYFSFNDIQKAPPEILTSFNEVRAAVHPLSADL